MGQLALYRKYRPSKFKEILGQEPVVAVLAGALAQGKVTHAYLFTGPRGTGKTSAARILAQELGTSQNDLYEIDAASNRGVDEIRELREAVRTLPFDSKYKVYIVDEVHMLTREAFNALLKTLEEPPGHVIFILATTEAHKLPETIVSRCQTLNFRKPSPEILLLALKQIAQSESWQVEPAALELIALLGEGSFRDAIGVLQQVSAACPEAKLNRPPKQINRALVEQVMAAPRQVLIESFLKAVVTGDLAESLAVVRRAAAANYDFKILVKLILRQLRSALLLKFAPTLQTELRANFSPTEVKFLSELASGPRAAILPKLLRELLTVYDELGRGDLPELPLELMLVNLLRNQA